LSAKVITPDVVSASMMPRLRAAVRSCVEPGSAAETQTSRPAQSAMTYALTPWRRSRHPNELRHARWAIL